MERLRALFLGGFPQLADPEAALSVRGFFI
jgi:hypothetical protein